MRTSFHYINIHTLSQPFSCSSPERAIFMGLVSLI